MTGLILTTLSSVVVAQTNRYASEDLTSIAGFSSAVAVDGETVLVGEGGNSMTSGIVYIYSKDGMGAWTESDRIVADDAYEGDGFGTAIALSGNTLLVTAPNQNDGAGAVYVFDRASDGGWSQSTRLTTGATMSGDGLGSAMAVSEDLLILGAASKFKSAGAAIVFTRDTAGSWSGGDMIVAADSSEGDLFGASVATKGGHLFVGAPGKGNREGVVYIYANEGGVWTEVDQISAFGLDRNNRFGSAIATSDDMLLVSAPRFLRSTGSVFVYQMNEDGEWRQNGTFAPFDGAPNMRFGSSIATSSSGVWIGAPFANGRAGAVYAFHADANGVWTSSTKVMAESASRGSAFSGTIAIGSSVAVVGMPGAGGGSGAATIFENRDGSWVEAGSVEGDVEGFDSITGGQMQCEEGKSSRFDCDAVDMVSFVSVKDIGAPRGIKVNDVWGWTDPATGKEYALVGRNDATSFVDVTDAQNPVYIGELMRTEGAPTSTWRDIKVYKDHAFIVADGAPTHGMQIFDLTKLRNPQDMPIVFEEDAHYDGIGSAHNIVINESTGFGYAVGVGGSGNTCGGGLHMLNLENPTEPEFVGCFSDSNTGRSGTGYSHDAMCIVYAGPDADHQGKEICFGSNETAISISDVTDKSNPLALSSASYPNVGYAHQGWITEDHKYFYSNDELDETSGSVSHTRTLVWDVTDLDDPLLINEFMSTEQASDHNLYVKGNYVYQSNYVAGLRILDIQDPANPVEVGFFDTVPFGDNAAGFDGSWSNYPYFKSGNVIVTSGREGLFILKRRDVDI